MLDGFCRCVEYRTGNIRVFITEQLTNTAKSTTACTSGPNVWITMNTSEESVICTHDALVDNRAYIGTLATANTGYLIHMWIKEALIAFFHGYRFMWANGETCSAAIALLSHSLDTHW
jgi:hypothetical protein